MVRLGRTAFFLIVLLNFFRLDGVLINKVFYHRGRCADKLVFYFNHAPELYKHEDQQDVIYNLPKVQVSPAIRKTFDEIIKKSFKNIFLKFDNQALKIQFKLDPNQICQIQAYAFTPISAPYGLVFRIEHAYELGWQGCEFITNPKEIVLDFGHGGHDTGTRLGEIYEKDIVRQVGLKLAKILTQQGYVVHLTRHNDEFVPLDMRTYFANLYTNASLFVSLHANHANKHEVSGVETHRIDCNLLSKLEVKNLSDCHETYKNNDKLAQIVHREMINIAKHYAVIDRKIKRSVAQVLLGVEMPAVLIELGFLSNPQEAKLLSSQEYQLQLAQGISNGINSYMLAA